MPLSYYAKINRQKVQPKPKSGTKPAEKDTQLHWIFETRLDKI